MFGDSTTSTGVAVDDAPPRPSEASIVSPAMAVMADALMIPQVSPQEVTVESPAGRRRRYAVRVASRGMTPHELRLIEGVERQLDRVEELKKASKCKDRCEQPCTVGTIMNLDGVPTGVVLYTTSASALKISQFYKKIGLYASYGGSSVRIHLDRPPR